MVYGCVHGMLDDLAFSSPMFFFRYTHVRANLSMFFFRQVLYGHVGSREPPLFRSSNSNFLHSVLDDDISSL